MKRKLTAVLTAFSLLAAAGITVCAEEEPIFEVAICQFEQHEALDYATEGFQDALIKQLGDQVTFDIQNAQGDYSTCNLIINEFVASEVDLILANATAALQSAVTATADIPILGTSVSDYEAALELNIFDGTVGGNVSGTSDLAPLDEQAAMVAELFPKAEKVGLLYCSAEPNSQYQVDIVQSELKSLGFDCKLYTFSDSNDISSVTIIASSECDVIYIPTDNMAAANAELIANICIPDGTPIIAGEENTCRTCGIATFSIDYYDLGYITGEMAARILADGENISEMPIEYSNVFTKRYNEEICAQLGIEVPSDYVVLDAE